MTDTPIILNADQVAELAPRIDLARELRAMFSELGQEQAVQPAQSVTLFPENRGDFITYLGVQGTAGVFGAKLSPYLVTDGAPIITAWTLLMSMETGQPLLLCDSSQLTTERTAATTALAVDLLAARGATRLAIIGAGAGAQAHYRHVQNLRDWSSVTVYSPRLVSNVDRQANWRALRNDVQFADNAEVAAGDAEVVMLCTSSGTPVIDSAAIGANALVTSISTNVAQAHEIEPAWLSQAQVYCDYRATTPDSAGEMVIAAQNHGWSKNAIQGDLAALVNYNCTRPVPGKPIFFRSIGLGLEDVAAAKALFSLITQN